MQRQCPSQLGKGSGVVYLDWMYDLYCGRKMVLKLRLSFIRKLQGKRRVKCNQDVQLILTSNKLSRDRLRL